MLLISRYARLSLLLWLGLWSSAGLTASLEQQRVWFRSAVQALEAQDEATFQQLNAQLRDYPLSYYLRYRDLSRRLAQASSTEVRAFLDSYGEAPLAASLRSDWLALLARNGDWATFLAAYRPQKNPSLRCQQVRANLQLGRNSQAIQQQAVALWLVPHPQPADCDAVFEYLDRAQVLTDNLIWKRLRLALEHNKDKKGLGLANFLVKKLQAPRLQNLAKQWLALVNNPATGLEQLSFESDDNETWAVLRNGLKRLAQQDLEQAVRIWSEWQRRYSFPVYERADIEQALAQAALRQNHPQALNRLALLRPMQIDPDLRQTWLQLALRTGNWPSVATLVRKLYQDDRAAPQWRYWLARALEETRQPTEAKGLFQALAAERDYYGFLAADRVGAPYRMNHQPVSVSEAQLQALLQKRPGLLRAREFNEQGLDKLARREWQASLEQLSPDELTAAAVQASRWQWLDRALVTAGKSPAYNDLDIRFPLAYRQVLQIGAEEQGVDLAWIYGVIRQESAFMRGVSSSAGARGLMQLMPATGMAVAKQIGLELTNADEIFEETNNVRLGSAYLRQMLDKFDGNYMLATAAYNAGPGRPVRWRSELGCQPPDVWVELIPFKETRNYVQNVLANTVVFEARLGYKPSPLRLAPASPDCAATVGVAP